MRIGVISDTHGYFDPQLPRLMGQVDIILHAGDVGTQAVMDDLRAIAPFHAVRGNVDPEALGLPPTLNLSLGGVQIRMLHAVEKDQSLIRDWAAAASATGKAEDQQRRFLARLPAGCQVVIFGHSHEPCAIILGGKLFLNPGSAGKKRFSLPRCFCILEIGHQTLKATFLGLEKYNDDLPENVSLSLGGLAK
jgi:uncharacterized protein